MAWEYMYARGRFYGENVRKLNEYGDEGWELVHYDNEEAIFKRPKSETLESRVQKLESEFALMMRMARL